MAKKKKTDKDPRGKNNPDLPKHGKATRFTKDNQPTPEQKAAGHRKKKMIKEISEALVTGKAFLQPTGQNGQGPSMIQMAADHFGLEPDEINYETLADLVQLHKAIMNRDTRAYRAYKEYLRGRPKQQVELTGDLVRKVGFGTGDLVTGEEEEYD